MRHCAVNPKAAWRTLGLLFLFLLACSDTVTTPSGRQLYKPRAFREQELKMLNALADIPIALRVQAVAAGMTVVSSPAIDGSLRKVFDCIANAPAAQRVQCMMTRGLERNVKRVLSRSARKALDSGDIMSFRRHMVGHYGVSRSEAYGADLGSLLVMACMDRTRSAREKKFIVYRIVKHIFLSARHGTGLPTSEQALVLFVTGDSAFVGVNFVCMVDELGDSSGQMLLVKGVSAAQSHPKENLQNLYDEFVELLQIDGSKLSRQVAASCRQRSGSIGSTTSDLAENTSVSSSRTTGEGVPGKVSGQSNTESGQSSPPQAKDELSAIVKLDFRTPAKALRVIENALRSNGYSRISICLFENLPDSLEYISDRHILYHTCTTPEMNALIGSSELVVLRSHHHSILAARGTRSLCAVPIKGFPETPSGRRTREEAINTWTNCIAEIPDPNYACVVLGPETSFPDLFLLLQGAAGFSLSAIVPESSYPLQEEIANQLARSSDPICDPYGGGFGKARMNRTSVSMSGGSLTGGRSRASIMRVVMQNLAALRYTYNKWLFRNPGVKVKMTVRFAIDEFGSVIFCEVVQSNLNDREFDNSITEKMKRWAFGKIDKPGDVTEVVYPFVFSE